MHPHPPKWAKSPLVVEMRSRTSETGRRPIARPADDADADRLFKRASHEYPTDRLLRLRYGSKVLRIEPANGLGSCADGASLARHLS
jgi:hypothetical protein